MASETLKEYLVKLGWDVNKQGFDNATDLVDKFAAKMINKAGSMGTAFVSASASMVKASLATVDAISDIAFSVAEADTAVERLARKYWISEKSARSLQNAQEQLGISVEDLMYATDEEYKRFLKLNEYGKSLEAPAALDETLVKIRDIQFEISKFRSLLSYGSRWLVYYLGQYLGFDIDELRTKFATFNDWLRTNMPIITQKVAKFLSISWRFAKTVLTLIYSLGKGIVQVVERLGTSGVASVAALAAAFKLAAMGPIGWVLMALTAIVLLLEDFMVWKQGGKSLFDWSGIEEPMNDLWSSILDVADASGDLFDSIKKIFSYLGGKQTFINGINELLKITAGFIDFISTGLSAINALLNPKDNNLQRKAENKVSEMFKKIGSFFGEKVDESGITKKGFFGKLADMINPYVGGDNPMPKRDGPVVGDVNSPAYRTMMQNSSSTSIITGDIKTYVGGSSASPEEIGTKIADKINALRRTSSPNSRMTR